MILLISSLVLISVLVMAMGIYRTFGSPITPEFERKDFSMKSYDYWSDMHEVTYDKKARPAVLFAVMYLEKNLIAYPFSLIGYVGKDGILDVVTVINGGVV